MHEYCLGYWQVNWGDKKAGVCGGSKEIFDAYWSSTNLAIDGWALNCSPKV